MSVEQVCVCVSNETVLLYMTNNKFVLHEMCVQFESADRRVCVSGGITEEHGRSDVSSYF